MFFNEDFYTNCSGVKHRKRKKKESNEDDIIALNHKVMQRFITDIEETKINLKKIFLDLLQYKVPYGIEQKEIDDVNQQIIALQFNKDFCDTFSSHSTFSGLVSETKNKKSICYSDYKNLLQEFKTLCQKNIIPLFEDYKWKTKPLIEQYQVVLNKPVKINFFGKVTTEKNTELTDLKEKIMTLIKNFYPDLLQNTSNKKDEQTTQNLCPNCDNTDFVLEYNKQICTSCGMEMESILIDSEFVDVERVNFSKKYT